MSKEESDLSNLNTPQLLLKISTDVAEIKSDMTHFKATNKAEKEELLEKIADVRTDCEKELARQDAQIRQLNTYIEAVRTEKDKADAKKWRVVVAFILTGLGGMILSRVPDILLLIVKAMLEAKQG